MSKLTSILKSHYSNKHLYKKTPLIYSEYLSSVFNNNIYLKREDQQLCKSYHIRGIYCKLNNIYNNEFDKQFLKYKDQKYIQLLKQKNIETIIKYKIVMDFFNKCQIKPVLNTFVTTGTGYKTCSIAYACKTFNVEPIVFVKNNTPNNIKDIIKQFNNKTKIYEYGNNYNDCLDKAITYSNSNGYNFIHEDEDMIIGNASIAKEIHDEINTDYILSNIELLPSLKYYYDEIDNEPYIIGIEPSLEYNDIKYKEGIKGNGVLIYTLRQLTKKIKNKNIVCIVSEY